MTDDPTAARRDAARRQSSKAAGGDVPSAPTVPARRPAKDASGGTRRTGAARTADERATRQVPATSAGEHPPSGHSSVLDALERLEQLERRGPFEIPDIVPAERGEAAASEPDDTSTLPPLVMSRRRPRVRRVTRVVRHIDTWSVFKVALVFHVFLYVVVLTSGVLLWKVAENTGTIDNVERFFESFGWETFELKGGEIYHNAWTGGLFVVVGLTGLAVLVATLFNLITDLVGGIRVSVLEEEVVATDLGRPRSRLGELVDRFTAGFR